MRLPAHAPVQPDGWSAQPIVVVRRFAPDADLDPAAATPVGDEGYFLYVLTEAAKWDFSDATSFFLLNLAASVGAWLDHPGKSPESSGIRPHRDLGLEKPRYHGGVMQRVLDGDRNPIAYLWQTMSDGQLQIGKPNRPPRSSGAWRSFDDGIN